MRYNKHTRHFWQEIQIFNFKNNNFLFFPSMSYNGDPQVKMIEIPKGIPKATT